ncbi:hypothetical protein ZIOFF_025381 [Zingiber officinale]|uniref:Uncharacterized protein n=1 Tax=Zingiber officinale TaxID=94328 RepID=A0A8J5GUX8_ZINOF|nr:hypothetical protein ZIOFF_025381 [Zingiber officinale]
MDVVSPILQVSGASHVVNKLVDKATTYVRDQYYWKTDLQEELQNLRRLLPQIQVIVGFAEDRLTSYGSSNRALMEWLGQFRDGIDEAEEVLDELEYLELEKKANSDKNRLSKTVDGSVKAAKRFLKFDDLLIERLRACVKNLNASASNAHNFLAILGHTGGIGTGQMQQEFLPLTDQSRITSSLPEVLFKGREEQKQEIIRYLSGESVEESEIQMSENVHCLPLVAMGGMGKTTLAQQVFDHFENMKKEHFGIRIWVCDSLPDLDATSILKKILDSTRQSDDSSTNLDASSLMKKMLDLTHQSESSELLPVKLKEKLSSKKFLLVLDDAWDDKNQTAWKRLCDPLLHGQKGSWILLTTRMESVAKMVSKVIKGTMKSMKLQGLSKDECRSLLYEHAFAGQDPDKFPQLKEIGEEILEKLKGVPLLAKSIGGALNSKLTEDHWTSISRSELWKTPLESKYEFRPVLILSYLMLPPRLKRCFSYCGIFPQDYEFNKQKLMYMWVAAGLIYSEESEEGSDEDIANSCFDTLCNKSFFDNRSMPRMKKIFFYDTTEEIYTMHDMLNSLACHVSRYECCRIVHGTPSRILDSNVIRHISITYSTDAQLLDLAKMVCKLKHLQTLWIQYNGDPKKLDDFIRDACKSPRRIRVLIVQSNDFKISNQCLKSIRDFVKIRFLEIQTIPPSLSMRKFYFLQYLIGDRYHSHLGCLAKDSNKLTNLRHLYQVAEDALLSVAEVGKLTSLQELCFTVGTKPRYRIDELMYMNNLRQLKIKQLSNVQSLEEANMVNLVEKRHLTSLELDWFGKRDASNPDLDQQEVLAALQPSTTIKELMIRWNKGGRPVPWMDTPSLSRLEHLQLEFCTSWEELPPLWKLPHLKFLRLVYMKAIRSLGCPLSDRMDIQFPVLEELEFHDLPLLEEWNGADDYVWFPLLKSVQIEKCPRLKKIPDLPLSIENLRFKDLGLEDLPRFYKCSNGSRTFGGFQQLMFLKSLEIYKCPGIAQIGAIGEEDDHLLPSSLETLELENIEEHKDLANYLRSLTLLTKFHLHCSPGLESFPLASELEHLTVLQDLCISDGESLTSLGDLYILKSLKSLEIFDCPKFLVAEVESEKFLKDTTRKHAVSSSSIFDQSAGNKAARILPSSLESLKFKNSDISQERLGRCLQDLTSLRRLEVSNCQHLMSLPNIEYLHNLTALRALDISDCKELCELESLTTIASLIYLDIKCCPKLLATTFATLQNPATATEQSATKKKKGTLPFLERIDIDDIFYLPMLPISEKLKRLYIESSDKEFTCFPSEIEESLLQYRKSLEYLGLDRIPHLQSLPAILESFSSLKDLCIYSAPALKSLPRMPVSLERLRIFGCSAKLKKRCQENIGRDWPNIKHIPYIDIRAGKENKAEVC